MPERTADRKQGARNCGTLGTVPANNLRFWRLQRDKSISEAAFAAGVSPRLITKIEASPADYVLKSDTMEKLSDGLGVPAFMLFFPQDIALLNHMLSAALVRILASQNAGFLTPEAMVSMFLQPQRDGRSSAGSQRSPAPGTR